MNVFIWIEFYEYSYSAYQSIFYTTDLYKYYTYKCMAMFLLILCSFFFYVQIRMITLLKCIFYPNQKLFATVSFTRLRYG